MVSSWLRSIARCPECRSPLTGGVEELECADCGRRYASAGGGYLDLRPARRFDETTKYTDASLHADARHERVSPPLLSAGVRHDMLRRFLCPGPGDRIIDLGCGSGRTLVWTQDIGAQAVGVDVSPFFAEEARTGVDLALADLRRLPFADATFTKAWTLDVMEHLSPAALRAMLDEAARVLVPGGALFAYSHVRRNSRLAIGLRGINALARRLERAGLIDMTQERLRKSDHLNPLADLAELQHVSEAAGFRIARIRSYTPLIGGFIENILVRVVERALTRRTARREGTVRPKLRLTADATPTAERARKADITPGDDKTDTAPVDNRVDLDGSEAADRAASLRAARTAAKRRIATRGPLYLALRGLTMLMKLDLLLFGRVPSGPFFVLLIKEEAPAR
jgi:SAM-dependent methyltransferase